VLPVGKNQFVSPLTRRIVAPHTLCILSLGFPDEISFREISRNGSETSFVILQNKWLISRKICVLRETVIPRKRIEMAQLNETGEKDQTK
jgi:hypothetical protein